MNTSKTNTDIKTKSQPTNGAVSKKRRIRVQFDIDYYGSAGILGDPESQAVPDMNLTIRQLLETYSKGEELPNKEPLYFETEIPTIKDMTDVDAFKKQLEARLQSVNNFLDDEEAKSKRAEENAARMAQAKTDRTSTSDPDPDNISRT